MTAAHAAMRKASVTPGDRLGLTLFLAAVVHAIAILGISFGADAKKPSVAPSLEIILVQSAAKQAPEQADYIAQADTLASGTAGAKLRPTSPLSGPAPAGTAGLAPITTRAAPAAQPESTERMLLSQARADQKIPDEQQQAREAVNTGSSRAQLNLELARLSSELAEDAQRYAQRPRVNHLESVSAKSAIEAAYIKAWVDKVERVGNLNYPDDARRRKLRGKLILHALLDSEGDLVKSFVGSPSGQQVLDDAAMRIVQLAAPFRPFSADMREAYDQLMITRTWIFEADGELTTR